jgi:hypothetical protein
MCVHDLHRVWEIYKSKTRRFVDAQEAWVKREVEIPLPASIIWEYLTKPELEAGFLGYDYAERIDAGNGRVREGSGFHCAHGDLQVYSKVLDWKPFEYYTLHQSVLGLTYITTRRLTPIEHGTRVGVFLTMPEENSSDEVRHILQSAMDQGYTGLGAYIERDVASGKITLANAQP